MERTEATGFGIALVGHVALIWALKILLDSAAVLAPPPAMEVSFVEDVALVSSSPSAEAAAPAAGEDLGPVEEALGDGAAVPEPAPEPMPVPEPIRTPSPPAPRDRPEEPRRTARSNVPSQIRQPQRQQPTQRSQPTQRQQVAQRPAPRGQGQARRSSGSVLDRLSREFGRGPANSQGKAANPRAATASPQARASFVAALGRQIARCSRQQRPPAIEARSLRPVVVIRLREDGSLDGAPTVRAIEGLNEGNRQYEQQARDAILRAIRSCAPYTGLPAELYDVPNGWRQPPPIRLNFQ